MNRLFFSLLAAASLTLPLAATAQDQAPAPVERPHYRGSANGATAAPARVLNPAEGVQVLTDGQIDTVSSTSGRVELRLTTGRANISVNNPADGTMILVDLPGGQADLVKDGFYTLNASTNKLAVLHGEAVAFPPNAPPDAEGKTVKEMQGAILGQHIHPDDLYEAQAQDDILQGPPGSQGEGNQRTYANRDDSYGYGDGGYGYGDGYTAGYGYGYGYPYYSGYYGYGGYPWGWSSAWGYPGFGFGGYYGGGYYGGGYYRGGYGSHGLPGHYGYYPGHSGGYGGGSIHPGFSGSSHGSYAGGSSSHGGFSGGSSHGSSGGSSSHSGGHR